MSLSTCEHCGGHIPLGPDASNRCETCGRGISDATYELTPEDKEWMGFPADGRAELQPEIDRLRARVAELEEVFPALYSAAAIFNHDGDSIWDATKARVLKVMPSLKR